MSLDRFSPQMSAPGKGEKAWHALHTDEVLRQRAMFLISANQQHKASGPTSEIGRPNGLHVRSGSPHSPLGHLPCHHTPQSKMTIRSTKAQKNEASQ